MRKESAESGKRRKGRRKIGKRSRRLRMLCRGRRMSW